MPSRSFDALVQSIKESALPLSSMEEDALRDRIFEADLIWGYDPKKGLLALFYGEELLADIAKGREEEFGHQMLLCFEIDMTSEEPEKLRKTVKALKSSCCYKLIRPDQEGGG